MRETPVIKLLMKLSPPVMLALLIQSVYNIVDSYFISSYSEAGLTALSIIFPIQLLITALSTGTGSGINIMISQMDGMGNRKSQGNVVKTGTFLGILNYAVFTLIGLVCLNQYYQVSSNQQMVQEYGIQYGTIILLFSFGTFMEANFTKMLQAKGNMLLPMAAQIIGAIINVILDYILIFGKFGVHEMGIQGAAIATVMGQWVSMVITWIAVHRTTSHDGKFDWKIGMAIYRHGGPSIVMQSLYTIYIVGLNLILKQFTEDAVTVLGIYYKLQTFFFIPLMGLQQVILPVISYNYGAKEQGRVKQILRCSILFSGVFMLVGTMIFLAVPEQLIGIFSRKENLLLIGGHALRVISVSFVPAAMVMMFTVFFQGVELGMHSIKITVLRQIILLVPLAWLLHFGGLKLVWMTFPLTELIAGGYSLYLFYKCTKHELTLTKV
ncbi:MAG: MATE family efflux transporter [bacterium]|nr:MATE family efflux transporter [bacterium]